MSVPVGTVLLGVYALLLIGGGVLGYVKARSRPSLVAGVGSGIIALAALALTLREGTRWSGLFLGLLLSCALTVLFLRRFAASRKLMPAGLLAGASILVAVLLLVVLGTLRGS